MLKISRPVVEELLAKYVEHGQALVERASLVGDFSDYESWKAARKNWIELTVQALGHIYDQAEEVDRFKSAASAPARGQTWQVVYASDLQSVQAAIDVVISLGSQLELEQEPAGGSEPEQESLVRSLLEQQPFGSPLEPSSDSAREREPSVGLNVAQEPAADAGPATEPAGGSKRAAEPAVGSELAGEPSVGVDLAPALSVGSELAPAPSGSGDLVQPFDNRSASAMPATGSAVAKPDRTSQVFLVHGRNEKWKLAIVGLLERAGPYEVTILNERPNDRRTLVEQFEQAPGPRYAVVLLTADDVGAPRLESNHEPYFSPRARQGVVFEMGFLVATLTPRRVCVLYEDGVELPCDLDGIAYVRLDLAGTWQSKLLLHLRIAGFDYDLNKLAAV